MSLEGPICEASGHFRQLAYLARLVEFRCVCELANMSRSDAIARARQELQSGEFLAELARRVAYRTESQNAERRDCLRAYLEEELQPSFSRLDFESRLIESPCGGAPYLLAHYRENPQAPTVLMYGHGDVVDGMAGEWRDHLDPWAVTRRENRVYGRGTADNKGQHSVNLAALGAVRAARGGRRGCPTRSAACLPTSRSSRRPTSRNSRTIGARTACRRLSGSTPGTRWRYWRYRRAISASPPTLFPDKRVPCCNFALWSAPNSTPWSTVCGRICAPAAFRWSRSAGPRALSPRAPISTVHGSIGRRNRSGRPRAGGLRCCRISAARCPMTCSPIRSVCRRSGCRTPIPAVRSMRPTSTSCLTSPRKRSASWPACFGISAKCRVHSRRAMRRLEMALSAPVTLPESSREKGFTRLVVAVSIGNALEWYDISSYGYFAVYVSRAFFPNSDPTISLLLTFGTFGLAFLIRPIGGVVLGAYADRHGRKASLMVSIVLMTTGTLAIAIMPSYETIGLVAPIAVLAARLVQGFSAGGEFGSSTAFLVEHAPGRRGFIASWQFASQGLGQVLSSLFGIGLTSWMTAADLNSWGWRIPFLFGILVGPVGIYIRNHLEDATAPPAAKHEPVVGKVFTEQKLRVVLAIGALAVSTAVNYLIVYMPTYVVKTLNLAPTVGFTATLAAAVAVTILTPVAGTVSDRVGRTTHMIAVGLLLLVSVFPAFLLFTRTPVAAVLVLAVL